MAARRKSNFSKQVKAYLDEMRDRRDYTASHLRLKRERFAEIEDILERDEKFAREQGRKFEYALHDKHGFLQNDIVVHVSPATPFWANKLIISSDEFLSVWKKPISKAGLSGSDSFSCYAKTDGGYGSFDSSSLMFNCGRANKASIEIRFAWPGLQAAAMVELIYMNVQHDIIIATNDDIFTHNSDRLAFTFRMEDWARRTPFGAFAPSQAAAE